MTEVTTRPSITAWTDLKLSAIYIMVETLTNRVLDLCSPMSRIYHADQYRILARKFRMAADFLDQRSVELERFTNG